MAMKVLNKELEEYIPTDSSFQGKRSGTLGGG